MGTPWWSGLCPKILKATEHSQKQKKHYMQKVKALSHSVVSDSLRPHVACQAPLSMEFSRQEYWRGLPFPSSRDPPDPGFKPRSLTLQVVSLTSEPLGKPQEYWSGCNWSTAWSEVVGGLEGWVMGCEGWRPSPYRLPQVHRRHSNYVTAVAGRGRPHCWRQEAHRCYVTGSGSYRMNGSPLNSGLQQPKAQLWGHIPYFRLGLCGTEHVAYCSQ